MPSARFYSLFYNNIHCVTDVPKRNCNLPLHDEIMVFILLLKSYVLFISAESCDISLNSVTALAV